MKILKSFVLGGLAFSLIGCASILSKSEYPVVVQTHPEHVKFSIEKTTGEKIFEGTTPTTVVLKAGDGYFKKSTYKVVFYDSNGEAKKEIMLDPNVDPWYVGNVIFGGLIGLLIVDPLTGAMWKLPEKVNIDLQALSEEKTTTIYFGKKKLKIASYEDIPDYLKSKLKRID